MNVNLLIDSLVRQTTVLLAQLATAAGSRAQLAHTANQVFLDLVHELKDQGLGNKVIADMFGLSLRTYHNKIARLAESGTDRGRSLWEAVFAYVQERDTTSRSELMHRFRGDDEGLVRGVLKDLVDSGMLFRAGRGDLATYRAATPNDAPNSEGLLDERLSTFAWVAIHRYGPLSLAELLEHVPGGEEALGAALERLVGTKRLTTEERDGRLVYSSAECVIPLGATAGWEAAVFDHYQAMVTAICTKLRLGKTHAVAGEWVGGSTYGYDVWEGHPFHDDVVGFLQATRERAMALRKDVEGYNVSHSPPDGATHHVITYVGQTVLGLDEQGDDE